MKRNLFVIAVGLCFALAMTGNAQAGAAGLARIGIGAYGFTSIPLVQDDATNGSLFGIKGRIGLLSYLDFEPSVNFVKSGDGEYTPDGGGDPITFDGIKATSYAFNVIIGGLIYSTAGIGWTSLDLNVVGEDSTSETTYNFGAGVDVPAGPISIDASGRLFIINTAESASRKSLAIMAGVNYYFF